MEYSGYKVTEKQSENTQKYSGKVIPSGMEMISFDLTKSTYELAVKKGNFSLNIVTLLQN